MRDYVGCGCAEQRYGSRDEPTRERPIAHAVEEPGDREGAKALPHCCCLPVVGILEIGLGPGRTLRLLVERRARQPPNPTPGPLATTSGRDLGL